MVNRIPTLYNVTKVRNVLRLLQALKISNQLGYLETFVDLNDILNESYVLDMVPELWQFLNCENNGTWQLVSGSYINPNNVTEVTDVLKFKSKVLC